MDSKAEAVLHRLSIMATMEQNKHSCIDEVVKLRTTGSCDKLVINVTWFVKMNLQSKM